MAEPGKLALILGASRGLGLAMVKALLDRGWAVVATVRTAPPQSLNDLPADVAARLSIEHLDITRQQDIHALRKRLDGRRFDLIIANAGICTDIDANMAEISDDRFVAMMVTNALGPVRALEILQDLAPPESVLAAMSSILGSQTENVSGMWAAYAASKAALNMLLHDFAARHSSHRAVIVMAPGWVRTDMGGAGAALSIEQSIPRVIEVLISQAGKRGLQYLNYDGRSLAW